MSQCIIYQLILLNQRLQLSQVVLSSCIPVYDSGSVFDPSVLDITDSDILAKFCEVMWGVLKIKREKKR